MLTEKTLSKILPNCKKPVLWAELINNYCPNFGVESVGQLADFIAQYGHESMEFNILQENLNYSSDRLLTIFPKYFRGMNREELKTYHRNPDKIANRVYANRMGNGNTESGDGFRFIGRGIIQLTGKNNYAALSKEMYGDEQFLLNKPETLLSPEDAIQAALWFWRVNGLSKVTDFTRLTQKINGATIGLEHRKELRARAIQYL